MSRVLTNNMTLSYAIEASIGVLPGSPLWHILEPNTLGAYGATITTVARDPISRNRQRRKGTVTDLDSAVDWDGDLTMTHFVDFVEGFVFSTAVNNDLNFRAATTSGASYTVPALSVDQAAKLLFAATAPVSLMFARGYLLAANNGIKPLTAKPTSTGTIITVSGLSAETPPTNSGLDIAGVRTDTDDLDITVSGFTAALTSGNGVGTAMDFTILGLTVGQFVHIGGLTATNQFDNGFGYARITGIAAGQLDLDKLDATILTDATGAGKKIDILFGRFIRNVPTSSDEFLERSFQYELAYPDLESVGTDRYEYAKGNFINTMALSMPLADKASVSFASIGTDAEPPVLARETNAETAIEPSRTGAFNTTSDCTRLRIAELDESGIYTDFKSLTVTFGNNVSPEKILCNLGAKFMNFGNFQVDVEAQLIFSDARIASAVRENRTLSMDFGLKNDDGAMFIDIPAMTLGGGDKEFPVNETVLINTTGEAFADPTLNTSIGISLFPIVP